MTPQQPRERELLVAERPLRSEFGGAGRERRYARRRLATLIVIALAVGGVCYVAWGHRAPNPADIPTIPAAVGYKNKPADPGGIDIPNQDVEIYNQIEGKGAPAPPVEHLLPPPEKPEAMPVVALSSPSPQPQPVAQPAPALANPQANAVLPPAALVPTTVTPVPVTAPAPVAKAPPQTIAEIIERAPPSPPPPLKTAVSSGNAIVQLASLPDESAARALMLNLQQKYATDLQGVTLRLTRADLGGRGVFYRIQGQGLSQDAADRLCSALRQKHAGCILVRK